MGKFEIKKKEVELVLEFIFSRIIKKEMKLSNKAITVGKGEKCPKCFKEMDRKKHPPHWKSVKSFYYTEWDHCRSCQHVQHYEKFKSNEWKEQERQQDFFRMLR